MTGLPRSLELLWGVGDSGRRGPKPGLDIRDIARVAVSIADHEGLDAVSMGRVAAELGRTTMALYRYVDAKRDLLDLMLDEAVGPADFARRRAKGWRRGLETWARAYRAVLLAHPWAVHIPIAGPPLTPHQLDWMEAGIAALDDTTLTESDKPMVLLLVNSYVRGSAALTADMTASHGSEDAVTEAMQTYTAALVGLIDAERYPALIRAIEAGGLDDDLDNSDADFEAGLATLLDGVANLVKTRGT